MTRALTPPSGQHADSATGTGERHSRYARNHDTGHRSATETVTLARTGAPECHRFRDTGLALESSASRRRDTGRKWALECRQDAPFSFPNHSEMTLNHSQEPHRSNIMLLQAVSHSSDDISHSNPSFGGGTGRHWALECHRSGDTGRHWGTAVPQFYRHWSGTGHSVPL